jgi:magnesium transporter
MVSFFPKRSKKAGLSPGSLVYIGEDRKKTNKITVIDYDEKNIQQKNIKKIEECFVYKTKPSITWIDIDGIHDTSIFTKLGDCYGFHPLILEDILNTDQRPKVEDFQNYLFIVVKMLSYDQKKKVVNDEQLSLILGSNFLISFQDNKKGDIFIPLRERLKNNQSRVRKTGADYLAYSLLDAVVDNYFSILEEIGEDLELLEDKLLHNPNEQVLQEIHHLKREMIFLRKSIWPLREVISHLMRSETILIKNTTDIYLKDVYDHTIQIIDTIEAYRDILASSLDIYLSSVNNRLNSIMKVLTAITTIFMPLTFITGLYGMNFKYMPLVELSGGFFIVLAASLVIVVIMLIFFNKRKWL